MLAKGPRTLYANSNKTCKSGAKWAIQTWNRNRRLLMRCLVSLPNVSKICKERSLRTWCYVVSNKIIGVEKKRVSTLGKSNNLEILSEQRRTRLQDYKQILKTRNRCWVQNFRVSKTAKTIWASDTAKNSWNNLKNWRCCSTISSPNNPRTYCSRMHWLKQTSTTPLFNSSSTLHSSNEPHSNHSNHLYKSSTTNCSKSLKRNWKQ